MCFEKTPSPTFAYHADVFPRPLGEGQGEGKKIYCGMSAPRTSACYARTPYHKRYFPFAHRERVRVDVEDAVPYILHTLQMFFPRPLGEGQSEGKKIYCGMSTLADVLLDIIQNKGRFGTDPYNKFL